MSFEHSTVATQCSKQARESEIIINIVLIYSDKSRTDRYLGFLRLIDSRRKQLKPLHCHIISNSTDFSIIANTLFMDFLKNCNKLSLPPRSPYACLFKRVLSLNTFSVEYILNV